eukprot:3819052-Amphidinium_carterae.1
MLSNARAPGRMRHASSTTHKPRTNGKGPPRFNAMSLYLKRTQASKLHNNNKHNKRTMNND